MGESPSRARTGQGNPWVHVKRTVRGTTSGFVAGLVVGFAVAMLYLLLR